MNPPARSRERDRGVERDRNPSGGPHAVTIRLAGPGDERSLARVAGRDSRPVPVPPRLVAIRDGEIDAVLSLRTGEVVADPFRPTANLVELLRCRAGGARFTAPDLPQPLPSQHDRRVLAPRLAGGCP